jgi:molybdopterin-binding protein
VSHEDLVEIALPTGVLISRVSPDATAQMALSLGKSVRARIKST